MGTRDWTGTCQFHCQWVQEIGQELANAIMRCVSSVNDKAKWWQNIELFIDFQ